MQALRDYTALQERTKSRTEEENWLQVHQLTSNNISSFLYQRKFFNINSTDIYSYLHRDHPSIKFVYTRDELTVRSFAFPPDG